MRFQALLLVLALLAGWSNVQAQDLIVIKFSHVVASDTPKGKAAQRFKELAEQATHGRVRVDLYPNSQLYKDKEELEALQLGAVQMLAPSLSKFGQFGVREFEVFDLPYIFPNKEAIQRITKGPIGKEILKKLEPKGIVGLGYWDNGFKVMSANRPLKDPADFDGLKMRIQPSKVLDAQMRALGATPQSMPFSDVYKALQHDVVDGTENPPSNFFTQRMYLQQNYLTVSNHGYLGYAVIVNKKFWTRLPTDIRLALEGAFEGATQYANAIAQIENERALEGIKKTGLTVVHYPTEKETEAWRKKLLPIHQELEERIGKELIALVKRELAQPVHR